MTSYMHGDVINAKKSLLKASEYVPFDEEQTLRYETWRARADLLEERRVKRAKVLTLQCQRYAKKIEGMGICKILAVVKRSRLTHTFAGFIHTIYDEKNKGDQLMKNGRLLQAASAYSTALDMIEQPKWFYDLKFRIRELIFEHYSAVDAMNTLTFKLHAGLAAAALKSHNYEEVVQLTDSALECRNFYVSCTNHKWDSSGHMSETSCMDWVEDQKLDLVRVHYSRGLSLHRLGNPMSGIEHLERALSFDPGDSTVSAQLTKLKQQRRMVVERQQKRLEKVNDQQRKLYTKQARRRTRNK